MKRVAFALIPIAFAGFAHANYSDVAQVVSSTPITDRVSAPRQECWTEQVSTYSPPARATEPVRYQPSSASNQSSGAGAVIGAIIGGVVGHQFGNSSGGRDRGTAAGAIVGGLIGHGIESSSATAASPTYSQNVQPAYQAPVETGTRSVERCRTVQDTREQISGYNVTYRYGNQQYTTRLPYDPGQTLRVRVNVTPEISR